MSLPGDSPLMDDAPLLDNFSNPLLGDASNGVKRRTWRETAKILQIDWIGILLGPVVSLPFSMCYASLLCSGTGLDSYFAIVLQQVMWTQIFLSIFPILNSQLVTPYNMDVVQSILFSQIVKGLKETYSEDPEYFAGDMMIILSILSALLGIVLYIVGRFQLGAVVRFLPYTVIGGFLAGIGFLIALEAVKLAIGMELSQLISDSMPLSRNAFDATRDLWLQVLLSIVYAVGNGFALSLHNFGTPIWMTSIVASAVFCRSYTHEQFPPSSWYTPYEGNTGWSSVFSVMEHSLPTFSQSIVKVNGRSVVSFLAIMTISWLFNVLGAQKIVPLKRNVSRFDNQREIQSQGEVNLLTSLLGGHAGYHSWKIPIIMKQVKANDLWPYFNLIANICLFFATPRIVVKSVPKLVFSGTILFLSWQIIEEWLIHSHSRIAFREWIVLCLTALATFVDIFTGICIGLVLTLVLFAIEYSSITGVIQTGSLINFHSLVDRSAVERGLLKAHGRRVRVLCLSGYCFFGSIAQAADDVRTVVENSSAEGLLVKIVVLDLSSVPAMDASGVYAIVDLVEELWNGATKTQLVLCGLVRRLQNALQHALIAQSIGVQREYLDIRCWKKCEGMLIHDLDTALEWCENCILETFQDQNAPRRAISPLAPPGEPTYVSMDDVGAVTLECAGGDYEFDTIWERLLNEDVRHKPESIAQAIMLLRKTAKCQAFDDGDVLFTCNQPADQIILLKSGSVEVTKLIEGGPKHMPLPRHHLNAEKGDVYVFEEPRMCRVQRARRGAVFGIIEYAASTLATNGELHGERHIYSGTAVGDTVVWVLSFQDLWRLECDDIVFALVFRTWISRITSVAFRNASSRSLSFRSPKRRPSSGHELDSPGSPVIYSSTAA